MIVPTFRGAKRLALALTVSCAAAYPAVAQGLSQVQIPGLAQAEEDGDLLFHGNYCGPGGRAGLPPVDALDAACQRHDACSPAVGTGLPSCGCNAQLAREAALIAETRRPIPDDERAAAGFVAAGARVLACR